MTMSDGKKVEGRAGKLARELARAAPHIIRGRVMILLERDEDVRVARADEAGGGVLDVQRL